ncbi:MAG: tRNA lysidine(34) synthetase TilS [Cyclobacteriaceae bacterium]
MHSLQKQFHDYVEERDLLRNNEKILLAVSGGLDSMAMCHLFLHAPWTFSVAHCNFNLRGEESEGDEYFVRKWGEKNSIEVHTQSFDLGEGSIQQNARKARYKWFAELCDEFDYTRIVTAHHLNDSLETTLINLTRGTGIKGITGIPVQLGNIIRPLLFASKKQLRDYAEEEGIEWREDSTNARTDYDRNLIRHEVIPKLLELNPSLTDTFYHTSERLNLTNKVFQARVDEIRKDNLRVEEACIKLNLDWISGHTDLVILAEILSEYGFNYATAREIFEAAGKSGKQFPLESVTASMDRNALFIKKNEEQKHEELLVESEGTYEFRNRQIRLSMEPKGDDPIPKNPLEECFDAEKIQFPLTLRKWREGDRFRPLGMKGSKKISDYLIDKKVPLALKDDVLVLTTQHEIIWLVGHQISDDYKVTTSSKEILSVKLD